MLLASSSLCCNEQTILYILSVVSFLYQKLIKLCEVYSVYHNQIIGSEVVFQVDMLLKYNRLIYSVSFRGVFIGRYAVRFE